MEKTTVTLQDVRKQRIVSALYSPHTIAAEKTMDKILGCEVYLNQKCCKSPVHLSFEAP